MVTGRLSLEDRVRDVGHVVPTSLVRTFVVDQVWVSNYLKNSRSLGGKKDTTSTPVRDY